MFHSYHLQKITFQNFLSYVIKLINRSTKSEKSIDIQDEKMVLLSVPRVIFINQTSNLKLVLSQKLLCTNHKYVVRFDIYPEIAPKVGVRHYGFVDIPIKDLSGENSLELSRKGVLCQGKLYVLTNQSFFEQGACLIHMHLLVNNKIVSNCVTKKFYFYEDSKFTPVIKHSAITVSTACNLKCSMCMRQTRENYFVNDYHMSLSEAETFFKKYNTIKSLLLMGIGEPLLNKNFFKICSKARECFGTDADINTGTNATLLTQKMSQRLANCGLSGVGFSVDGASSSVYENIRVGANFDKVIKNIKQFMEYLQKNNIHMHVWVNYVVQPSNVSECEKFVSLMDSIGIKDIKFSVMQDFAQKNSTK